MPNPTETMIARVGLALTFALVIVGTKSTWEATELHSVTVMVGIILTAIGFALINLFADAVRRFQTPPQDQQWCDAVERTEQLAGRPLRDNELEYLKKQFQIKKEKNG